jgi:HK97 family phage prohead protease
MKTAEHRIGATPIEIREDGDTCTLSGYASTFSQPYDMGWYEETVDPAAFKRTLGQKPDVRLLVNHGGLPLARTTSGTLTLAADDKGLLVTGELDRSDPDVQALIPKMQRGDLSQMSFAFRVLEDIWEDDMTKRTLLSVDLNDGDVSIVTYPANPNATATLRADGPNSEAIAAALRSLDARGAPDEDLIGVLTRALQHFTGASGGAADDALANQAEVDGTAESLRVTLSLLDLRKRKLRLL